MAHNVHRATQKIELRLNPDFLSFAPGEIAVSAAPKTMIENHILSQGEKTRRELPD